MSDFNDSNEFLFGFQIHHLMPSGVFDRFEELLMKAGVSMDVTRFALETVSNKKGYIK